MKPLLSFHGQQSIKENYLLRLQVHYDADEIIKGTYWEDGKGCAVGCTIHGDNHSKYETELGIPRIIARLEDRIFEGLPNGEAKEFPLQFLKAIPVGKDLSPVWKKFLVWLIVDKETGVIRHIKKPEVKKAAQDVADLITKSLTSEVSADQYKEARKILWSAAYAAAAYAYAYAAAAAADAADAADAAAAAAADAAAAAADADAAAAYAAYAYAADAAAAARVKRYQGMRDKLLELLKAA